MKKIAVFIAAAILVSACAQNQKPTNEVHGPTSQQIAKADYGSIPKEPQKTVMEYMKMATVDPLSAQYDRWSNLRKGWSNDYDSTYRYTTTIHYGYMGCVYINLKNRRGGYDGFDQYLFIIKNDKVVFLSRVYTEQCAALYQQTNTITGPEK